MDDKVTWKVKGKKVPPKRVEEPAPVEPTPSKPEGVKSNWRDFLWGFGSSGHFAASGCSM